MKKMTLGNRILAMLLAFVMILTGIAPGTCNARVVKAADATEQRFNRIYREEKMLTELTAEERYKQRLVKIKPLLDAFFAWG